MKPKRQARNATYYASAEWRDVKKRTHEVDGYQCRRIKPISRDAALEYVGSEGLQEMIRLYGIPGYRCENRGEVVNGKQTARGLVCDELSYNLRRGDGTKGSGTHEPGVTTRTLCADCNRLETTSKRANWMKH